MDALRVLPEEDPVLDGSLPGAEPESPYWPLAALPALSLILFFLALRAIAGGVWPEVSALLEPDSPPPARVGTTVAQILPFAAGPEMRLTEIGPTETAAPEAGPTETGPPGAGPATPAGPLEIGPPETALWPLAGRGLRFEHPLDVAHSFAEVFIGFADPIVGPYRPIDRHYGQVEIRSAADGPVTLVQVHRHVADQTWWAMGATSSSIELDHPSFGATIGDPLYLVGEALTERGQVHVEVRATGIPAPVLEVDFVTNGGLEPDWFEGAFGWTHPGRPYGAVVVVIHDMERNEVLEAAVLPIAFGIAQGELGV